MDNDTIDSIREWLEVDNSIRNRREKLKMLYERKNALESKITTYVKKKNMQDVQVNVSNGKLRFTEKNNLQGLSQGLLKEQLVAFFEEAAHKRDMTVDADNIYKYVLSHRKQYTSMEIVRDIVENDKEE
jgi:hypothetical protein